MNSKFGAKVLVGLMYGQALFGLVAVAAVVMKDPAPSSQRSSTGDVEYSVAAAGTVQVR